LAGECWGADRIRSLSKCQRPCSLQETDLGGAVGGEEHGAVGDAVLPGADELLAVEDEDVGVAGVVGEQRRHGPLPQLADAQRAGGDGVGEERVGQLGVVAGQEWEDGQELVRLRRADADVEHVGPPLFRRCWQGGRGV
jgi:hypothetical protein